MSNEWDTWKVGDRLTHRTTGRTYRITQTGQDSRGREAFQCTDESNSTISHWVYNIDARSNPSTYFFLIPPIPTWQKGDRVRRIGPDAGSVALGTLGTVTLIEDGDIVHVNWDTGRNDSYGPQYHSTFLEKCTGQLPRPVLHCSRCHEFNEYAEVNQPDGTFRCHQCRKDPWR